MKKIIVDKDVYLEYENDILVRKYNFYPNGNLVFEEIIKLGEKRVYSLEGKLRKKIITKNGVNETLDFYENGEIFRRKLTDELEEEEYIEYYSRKGEVITKLKNHLDMEYKLIYDFNSGKYLVAKEGKLYYNGRIYFGRVKYYSDVFLVEESYNREGKLNGVCKISHFEGGVLSEVEWKNGVIK